MEHTKRTVCRTARVVRGKVCVTVQVVVDVGDLQIGMRLCNTS